MAQVPVYQQTQTTGVEPSFRVSGSNAADQAGAQLGGAISSFGMNLADMAQKKMIADNQTAVQNAKTQYVQKMNDYQYNENMGTMYTKGALANGTTDMTRTYMKAVTDNILNSDDMKGNKSRQKAFLQSVSGLSNAYVETAMEHEYKQGQVAALQSTNASVESAKSAFMNNYPQLAQTKDAQGNAITNYASDEAMRAGLSSRATYDIQQGMPADAIQADLRNVSEDYISSAVTAAIQNNDFAGANAVLKRYGNDPTKMSAETYSKLNAAITKAAAPVRARTIAQDIMNKAGGDPMAAREGLSAYKDDPDYSKIRAETLANIADVKAEQADLKVKQQDEITKNLWNMGSFQKQTTYIQGLVAHGAISAKEAGTILERSHRVFSIMHPQDAKNLSDEMKEKKKWANYEVNGSLANDLVTINEFKNTAPEDMKPSLQRRANTASANLTQYWHFSSGGTWDPKRAAANDQKVYGFMGVVLQKAEILAERGYSKAEISQWATPYIQQIGLDPQSTLDTWFDWGSMGKQEGGVK